MADIASEFDLARECLKRHPPHCRKYAEREALRGVSERIDLQVSVENGVRLSRYMRLLMFREGVSHE